eukprot:8290901-Alexandrium_andersonii.AAC.1
MLKHGAIDNGTLDCDDPLDDLAFPTSNSNCNTQVFIIDELCVRVKACAEFLGIHGLLKCHRRNDAESE